MGALKILKIHISRRIMINVFTFRRCPNPWRSADPPVEIEG